MADTLVNCGHVAHTEGISTGFGTTAEGYTMCLPCMAKDEVEFHLPLTNVIVGYLSSDSRRVTGWPGHTLMTVERAWESKRAHKVYVHATDVHGEAWHGMGPRESGNYVTMRRNKVK